MQKNGDLGWVGFLGGVLFQVFKEKTVIWNKQDYKNRFKACGIHILGIPEVPDK